jgi:formylglycine-generating enzyme required for sulfatase activity
MYGLRLPSEAEWETAAAMHPHTTQKFRYSAGKDSPPPKKEAILPVGSLEKSPYGCYDMGGNIFEWIHEKVVKGSSYQSPPEESEITYRRPLAPDTCLPDVGFRVALD